MVYIRSLEVQVFVCGIAGIWSPSRNISPEERNKLIKARECLRLRGPDAEGIAHFERCSLAHRRLSIIDTDPRSNQPMSRGGYSLIFNGEIFNYRELRNALNRDYEASFETSSDTEVLLLGLIHEGESFLNRINGFFAFAFYNAEANEILVARDRFGIKPLYFSQLADCMIFGSNLTSIMAFIEKPSIDGSGLNLLLTLSYIPAPSTILSGVQKLEPGCLIKASEEKTERKRYYHLPDGVRQFEKEPEKVIRKLLSESVEARLIADVPVGTFLSGGVDSSIVSYLAGKTKSDIPCFSIGFPDQPYFDESRYARETAKYLGLEHHVFEVREKDLDESIDGILSSMDEPFADSSAILVNLLSQFTRKEVTVALSGDGADELFGGYNKHRGLLRSTLPGLTNRMLRSGSPALNYLPASRRHRAFNLIRKMKRYSKGLSIPFEDRYREWASFTTEYEVSKLLVQDNPISTNPIIHSKLQVLDAGDFNSVLRADFDLVLANDMLYKVDSMSMHRSLEVRVPFLDHRLVEYVFSLPSHLKLNKRSGKVLLKKAFEKDFPKGYFERRKKGFEAPLSHWFQGPLRPMVETLFSKEKIQSQGIFNYDEIQRVKQKALSRHAEDSTHTLWALFVFQYWFDRYMK